ncbi:MAG: site-2 protease family protein, partial [Candidatus Anstonellales archaeon]
SIAVLRFIFNSDLRIKVMEPGASLLLPGINLPLWEGIIALLVLLFVHETAHGILSRVSKIRVDSAGLVLFGIIPVGAFIEPNESELLSADNLTQKRVLIAGSAANFVFSIFSFFILSIFVILSSDLRQPALYILSGNSELESGAIIRAIDSQPISENFELPKFSAGQKVRLLTDKGEKTLIADENGRLGVLYVPLSNHGIGWRFVWKDGFESLNFIYSTIALLFLLNFIVGVVNLLPLPFFDGQRIFELSVNDKRIVNAITAGVTAAFLLNFLPWLFK